MVAGTQKEIVQVIFLSAGFCDSQKYIMTG